MENIVKIPQMLTIRETAALFNLPVHFVRQKVNSGEVVAVRAGRKFLVNVERFADYLNGNVGEKSAPRCFADEPTPRIAPISLK